MLCSHNTRSVRRWFDQSCDFGHEHYGTLSCTYIGNLRVKWIRWYKGGWVSRRLTAVALRGLYAAFAGGASPARGCTVGDWVNTAWLRPHKYPEEILAFRSAWIWTPSGSLTVLTAEEGRQGQFVRFHLVCASAICYEVWKFYAGCDIIE